MTQYLVVGIILLLLVAIGCDPQATGQAAINAGEDFVSDGLPREVARLSLLNLTSVDTFEKYQSFADNMNALIHLLNEKTDLFNIPELSATQEAWGKASNKITEYGPLINNYNNVVSAAKEFEKVQTKENLKAFYVHSGKFGFETALIVGAVFYTAVYTSVGYAYRAVQMNRLAFECGTCVSVILGNTHWFLRTTLVEGSSQLAQKLMNVTYDGISS
jgi:hypothetical protein